MNVLGQLAEIVGGEMIITGVAEMASATEDWRGRYHGAALCVTRPADTTQVSEIVACCHRHGVPVLPQGGNTGLVGGSVPASTGVAPVIVSLDRMRRIRSVDPVNSTIEVEAGCVLANVHDAAKSANRFYPVSLGSEGSCQIGGTIATNAGGTSVLRYGTTRDNVLGLEVVLPDGTIWSGLTGLRKNNTGYDLKHLFIGSEGTLGIITAAVLKLHPFPARTAVAWAGLDCPEDALKMLTLIQGTYGAKLSGFELMNRLQLDLVVKHVPQRRSPIETEHDWHLLIELSDSGGEGDLDEALQAVLEKGFSAELVANAVIAASEAQRAALWEVRHSVSEANKKAGVGLTTDCAVPVSATADFISKATENVHAIAPAASVVVVGHVGDGNIHFIPFFTFDAWNGLAERDALSLRIRHAVNDVAAALGGTFSAEHGVGQVQLAEMDRYKQPAELALMRVVKAAIDPKGLFNPGRLLPNT
ncbi:FAD-binding protein [Sinorhizobium medicae]|uniref:FAD linked oxidase domain protein n=1 Tax=Sinorhizobium medicae (strain WSM419) TaxID=366394 RepID=A6UKP8_SINMW|nr:FAD-binding oxidoreductase [Sinorhizobium medicae]ABR64228.1 FAD linked oxidase domain protein [Sinorhizobium medicae WSM419]MDX0430661.1 FAD-binding protein [Sinorhizobium medicae]MDX0445217.1 FAD-binding protein [Sinorhizobium medicae]MDX0523579.1 FAD-binding protein [Sinorhizobium medicae]MDX0571050.1 FAD-binding protein [Sinorhizobium medicae]